MTNPFIPSGSDAAMVLLWKIFGNVVNTMTSSPVNAGGAQVTDASNMLAAAFRYFDSGVLLFGSLILTAVTIFGVSNSASDGEVLGKTWNTFYTPVRTVAAAGSLIPAASGYAPVQIILLYVVAWSVGFASNLWTNVVSSVVATDVTQSALNSVADDTNFSNAVSQAIRMEVCAGAMNKAFNSLGLTNQAGQPLSLSFQTKPINGTWVGTQTAETIIYFADPYAPGSDKLCGSITLDDEQPVFKDAANAAASNGLQGLATAAVKDISTNQTLQTLRSDLASARLDFYKNMFSPDSSSPVPSEANAIMQAVDSAPPVSAQAMAADIANYKSQLENTIQTAVRNDISKQSTDALATALTSQGWTMAGSYWNNLAQIKDFVKSASESTLTTTEPDEAGIRSMFSNGDMYNAVSSIVIPYEVAAAEATKQALALPAAAGTANASPASPSLQSNFTLNDFTAGGTDVKQTVAQIYNKIPTWLVGKVVNAIGQQDDAVMHVKDIGDSITSVVDDILQWKADTTAVLAGIGKEADAVSNESVLGTNVSAATGIVSGIVKGISTFIDERFDIVKPALYTLMYLGNWMSIWLPMVPFYIFALGVIGWLLFVVEMMAAGMLWAAAHTTPARDNSFIGGQMQGYMLVMSGFFRPALMIIGLVASNAILGPAIDFINAAFLAKFESVAQGSELMTTSIAAYMLGYGTVLTSTFMMAFGLPQTLPDRILRWVGAGIGDLGEQGARGRIENTASSQAQQAMSRAMDSANKSPSGKDSSNPGASGQSDTGSKRHEEMLEAQSVSRYAQTMTDTGEGADISSRSERQGTEAKQQRDIEEKRHGEILEALGGRHQAQAMTDTGMGAAISPQKD
ncbi:hypothetical protein FAZ69_08335 [Trinickia terrae]|uniref:DotA/TraY family protein n=1 Tax=Trinickia terrae TaxID=2571161 RepID=A0A4U1I9I0_9BURK|nr:DotA/TraY family protein [Trinickia terrae]TKC90146.1 hypothetical protein FAZ69_08335 [Trinickia terrae]